MFKMMNPTNSQITFNIQVQDLNNSANIYTINTSVSVNAYTVKNYVVKWKVISSSEVTFYLQVTFNLY